jgi:hypothetical protein
VLNHRVAVLLLGPIATIGCGRLGFSDNDGPTILGNNDPCISKTTVVSESSEGALEPRMVWNGTKAGVAWLEDSTSLSGHFRTVSLDGTADPIANLGVLAQGETVQVAWDGANWRLAWSDDDPNREVMLSTDGAAPRSLTANSRQDMRAHIAPLPGGKIAYLWAVDPPAFSLRLTVFDASGAKLVDDLAIGTETDSLETHSLIWTGTELVAFYGANSKLMMVRMNPDGSQIAPPVKVVAAPDSFTVFNYASATWTGDRFLVAWSLSSGEFRIAYVDPSGQLMSPALIPPASALLSSVVAVAAGSTVDAVAWDNAEGSSYLVEVSRDGKLGMLYTFKDAYNPSAVWTGSTWAVALTQHYFPTPDGLPAKPANINLVQLCR